MTRPEHLAIVKLNLSSDRSYKIDAIIKSTGHEVLRLPPYHCDLNPIELIWATLKKKVGHRNLSYILNEVLFHTQDALKEISIDDKEKAVKHVKSTEDSYRKTNLAVDDQIDKIIIDLGADSSSTSDESSATDTASEGEYDM